MNGRKAIYLSATAKRCGNLIKGELVVSKSKHEPEIKLSYIRFPDDSIEFKDNNDAKFSVGKKNSRNKNQPLTQLQIFLHCLSVEILTESEKKLAKRKEVYVPKKINIADEQFILLFGTSDVESPLPKQIRRKNRISVNNYLQALYPKRNIHRFGNNKATLAKMKQVVLNHRNSNAGSRA